MNQRFLLSVLVFFCGLGPLFGQSEPCATVDITNPDTISICRGEILRLAQTNTLNDQNITWSPAEGFIDPVTDPSPLVAPTFSGYIRVVVGDPAGCQVADSIFVDVDNFVVPQLIDDITVCQGSPTLLITAPVIDPGNTLYTFSPGTGFFADSTNVNELFIPQRDTVITLISRAENGMCADTQSVTITVTPSVLTFGMDTSFNCLGSGPITLSATATPAAGGPLTFYPDRFSTDPAVGSNYTVEPTADITYFVEGVVNGCPQIDSIAVRLDSLPQDLSMMLDPEKDPYCQGDTFNVISPVYDAGDFPLITHEWTMATGLQSPRELYNGVFLAQDTADLIRITTNGGCIDTTQITVNVVEPPIVEFSPADPLVCPGQPLAIDATFVSGAGTLTWMDPNGTLSCTECEDPTATLTQSMEYMIELEAEGSDCTSELTYAVAVTSDVAPTLATQTTLCPGESLQLIVGNIIPGYSYRITGNGVDLTDPNASVTPSATTTYRIETTGPCGMSVQELVVTLSSPPDYTVTANGPSTVTQNERLQLDAETNPANLEGRYDWVLPGGATVSGQFIDVNNPSTGTYTVTFVDAAGCAGASDSITVTVVGGLAIPEVITPNGDNVNDSFRLFYGGTISDYTMIVFNRWGQKVWSSEDPNEGWDGTKDGTPQNQDTYLFLAKFTQDGAPQEREGQFTLIR